MVIRIFGRNFPPREEIVEFILSKILTNNENMNILTKHNHNKIGIGVYAKVFIPKDTIITKYDGFLVTKEYAINSPLQCQTHIATILANRVMIKGLSYLIPCNGVCSFINSSITPNCLFIRKEEEKHKLSWS
jgi:hypothetical protein